MTSRTGQIMRTWASCKPQKTFARPHALVHDYSESKDGSARRRFYVALHETVGRTEFYQAKTVKTHGNNLVVLAHVQLKSFYRLSTRDVTHVSPRAINSHSLVLFIIPNCTRNHAVTYTVVSRKSAHLRKSAHPLVFAQYPVQG